jgi:putative membrane protein
MIVCILVVVFALLNAGTVNVHYFFGDTRLPLSLLLFIVLAAGALIGWLSGIRMLLGNRKHTHDLNKKVKNLQKELNNLRAMPVKGDR